MADLPEGFKVVQSPEQQETTSLPEGFKVVSAPAQVTPEKQEEAKQRKGLMESVRTLENIAQVYPALETALQMVTSAYGIPIAGLMGLADLATTGDIEKANKVISQVQRAMVYAPMSKRGQELSQSAAYPFEKYEQGAEAVGGTVAEKFGPDAGAAVHSVISAAPSVLGAKTVRSRLKPSSLGKVGREAKKLVTENLSQSIKPSIKTRKTYKQKLKADNKAFEAVKTIIDEKDNILLDRDGVLTKGQLPQTIDDMSNAIGQAKQKIFEEYDNLVKQADDAEMARPVRYPLSPEDKGKPIVMKNGKPHIVDKDMFKINTEKSMRELKKLASNEKYADFDPDAIKIAQDLINRFDGKKYTPSEAQAGIKALNTATLEFQTNPTSQTAAKAYAASIVLNDIRQGIDKVVSKATGEAYKPLKRKYSALKSIEEDVARAVNREANKVKGMPTFTDVISAHQVISGIANWNPGALAGGAALEGFSMFRKFKRDPNVRIKNMFEQVDKRMKHIATEEGKRIEANIKKQLRSN